ncbi:MAG: ATP-binding protein [Desulfobacterales bacterium]
MPKYSNTYNTINKAMGRALHRYRMISDGNRILVAVSGGSDSLGLLWMLHERRLRIPVTYELFPVYIDLGFDDAFGRRLADFCESAIMPLRVEKTDFGRIAHSTENRENPCFLCSWLRRKRLFEIADQLACNKLAFGHNRDDIIETLFMNMCYTGEISTMVPSQSFFEGKFTVIRPLAFVDEDVIRRFAEEQGFFDLPNPCPSARQSKRSEIKRLLSDLYKSNKKIKGNIFRSLSRVKMDYMLQ